MAETSTIEWTDATWNPITGCTLVSEGCRHCYAAQLAATRLQNHPSRKGLARINAAGEAKFTGEVRINLDWLDQPLRWRRPRRIFVCAHGDLFHEGVPDEWIDQVFAVMSLAAQHTFQVLTKRPERARAYLTQDEGFGRWGYIEHHARHMANIPTGKTLANYGGSNLPHVWLGTSVEDQATADARIPHLLAAPAAVRFLSAEPLLGPVDLTEIAVPRPDLRASVMLDVLRGWGGPINRLDWVIVGGESGKHARPMHPDWARALRDQCVAAGVPFFFKQWGEWVGAEVYAEGGKGGMTRSQVAGEAFSGAPTHWWSGDCWGGAVSLRAGKAAAGRALDGRTWDETPAPAYQNPSQFPAQT